MKLNNSINKPLVFIIMLLISITLSFTILGYIYYLFPKLSDFRILKVYEEKNKLLLETTKCYNAIRYHLVALDENNNIVYENDSKTNIIDISEINLLYKQNINFEVVTYNKKNESKKSDKVYSYINQVAAFGDDKNYSTDKEDIKKQLGWSDKYYAIRYKHVLNFVDSESIDYLLEKDNFKLNKK